MWCVIEITISLAACSAGAKLWGTVTADCQEVLRPHLNTRYSINYWYMITVDYYQIHIYIPDYYQVCANIADNCTYTFFMCPTATPAVFPKLGKPLFPSSNNQSTSPFPSGSTGGALSSFTKYVFFSLRKKLWIQIN